jgi:cyclopropane-fatty-acyl-phospholipid synthase
MDGSIEFPGDSLIDFLLLANANLEHIKRVPLVAALVKIRFACRRWIQDNSMWRARRNIAHHYDLDERLYRLFLDADMQYSCAYFETPGADLDEAQWAKKRHIAAKLALEPGQEVLDIGSGWGGLGLFLAEHAAVSVTLSAEQHRVSNRRARDAGRDGQVRFELRDYGALDKSFDRIVSVGMFEHVGAAGTASSSARSPGCSGRTG